MIIPGSYSSGFAPRDFRPLYPELWRGCVGAWCPSLGPTGATLRDWSGYGSHGTLTNTTLSTAWSIAGGGYVVNLDGSNDQIIMGDYPHLEPVKHVSICCWTTPSTASQATDATIVAKEYSNPRGAPWVGYKLGLNASPNARYKFEFSAGGTIRSVLGGTIIAAGTTVFVVGTYDGINGRIYINGKQETASAFTGDLAYSNGRLMCGTNETGGDVYAGSVDDIRVYNRALTPSEITLLYNGGRGRGIAYAADMRRRWGMYSGSAASGNRRRRLLTLRGA